MRTAPWAIVLFRRASNRIAACASQHRLPAMCGDRDFVDEGALMPFSDRPPDTFRPTATCVDKLLEGTRPADRAIEVAHDVRAEDRRQNREDPGLTIAPSLLRQAGELVQ